MAKERARNYQASEAMQIVRNRDTDPDTFVDFVRRFPSFASIVIAEDFEALVSSIPFGSARQFDKAVWAFMTDGLEETDDGDDEDEAEVEEEEEKPEPKKSGKKKKEEPEEEAEAEGKYAGLSTKELYELCKKAELKVKTRQPAEYYIEKLEYADSRKAKEEPAEDEGWEEEEKPAKAKGKKAAKAEEEDTEADDEDWDF